jgi:hypothetical protein
MTWLGGPPRDEGPRVIRVTNTLEMERMWLSPGALAAALASGASIVEVEGPQELRFTAEGDLVGRASRTATDS